jgi:sterol desaturase/sphingolipid hydroxylase (fatty acid hydroxylase superfamily)
MGIMRACCWPIFPDGRYGQNFGVVFSFWDWIFGTAYMPAEGQPARLGFYRMEEFPEGLLARLLYPFWK